MASISVVIPNYNGKALLRKCLCSVNAALAKATGEHEIIVVDEMSTDGSVDFTRKTFPSVRVVQLDAGHCFAKLCNFGFSSCSKELVLLINNDVVLHEDFCLRAIGYFDDPKVFAVTGHIHNLGGPGINFSVNLPVYSRGMIRARRIDCENKASITLFASGAASLIDRDKLSTLGGFDDLFAPAYKEDVDLSYRAWKSGWKILFEPGCIAWHEGGATSAKVFSKQQVYEMKTRNHLKFMWKNTTDLSFLAGHFIWLLSKLPFSVIGDRILITAFAETMREMRQLLVKRRHAKNLFAFSDKQVFAIFSELDKESGSFGNPAPMTSVRGEAVV